MCVSLLSVLIVLNLYIFSLFLHCVLIYFLPFIVMPYLLAFFHCVLRVRFYNNINTSYCKETDFDPFHTTQYLCSQVPESG